MPILYHGKWLQQLNLKVLFYFSSENANITIMVFVVL